MNIGFQSHHLQFLGNSHIHQWKVRVQIISKWSAYKGTNFRVKQTFCTLYFLGNLISKPQYSHL